MDEPGRSVLHFCGYRLDPTEEQLRRSNEIVPLRRKTFAVLSYLAARPGRLVTKNELLASIWADTTVGEAVLTTSVKELRRVFGDEARNARVIETQHGRGYRFIATVVVTGADEPEPANEGSQESSAVGRSAELAVLVGWLRQALARKRQLGFVVAAAGIGKTTLIEEFLRGLSKDDTPCLIAYGQCLEQYSASEPYLPVIEALRQVCATPAGEPLAALLRQLAPSWLGLLPGLVSAPSTAALSEAATPARMRREMAAVIDSLPVPLVLVLEDLHWSDLATVDLLARLAQGRASTPLLLIGTYRAAEVTLQDHPLKAIHQELLARGQCRDLWLAPLAPAAVLDYLQHRCPGLEQGAELADVVYTRTDGNALFVVNVVNELVATGVLAETRGRWSLTVPITEFEVGIPAGLRQLLVTRLERHNEKQRAVLDAGSVAGRTFSAGEVAAALELPLVEVESELDFLARGAQVLRPAGSAVWPDGTAASRYEFSHALYEEVLYDLIPAARRGLWHSRIAERLERGYAGQTAEIAIHLARHFEEGGMVERAVAYLEEGAERASRFGAEREVGALLGRAVAILERLPRTPERVLRAIRTYLRLGQSYLRMRSLADSQGEWAFARAWALSQESDDAVQLFQATIGRTVVCLGRGEFDRAREMAHHLEGLMQRIPLPQFAFSAHLFMAITQFHSGSLAEARAHLDQVLALGELPQPAAFMNFWVLALSYDSLVLAHQGYPDQSRQQSQQALARAASESPYVLATAASWAIFSCLARRDSAAMAIAGEIAQRVGNENDEVMATAVGRFANGWLRAQRGESSGGIEAMQSAIDLLRTSGQVPALSAMMVTLAEALANAGDLEDARFRINEAQAFLQSNGDVRFAAEACRVEGELYRAGANLVGAERAFARAVEIARGQGARWFELRITASQARLMQQQGNGAAAYDALAAITQSITEGDDTEDLRDSRSLLATLK